MAPVSFGAPPMTLAHHTACLLCGDQRIPLLPGYERHGLVKCQGCGFVFMGRIPTDRELADFYGTYAYSEDKPLSPHTAKVYDQLLDGFEAYRKTNRLLDVGCGTGHFLERAKLRGWEVWGTEYSDAAIRICEAKGIPMVQGALDPANMPMQPFDVITSLEVLEHVTDPRAEIAAIHALLRKGGLLYCTTPNFNAVLRYRFKAAYSIIEYPEHLSYFTRATLTRALKAQGFRKQRFLTTGISFTRLQTSLQSPDGPMALPNDPDEEMRDRIGGKWYFNVAKKGLNHLLSWTGTGMTLKASFTKN